MKKTIKCFIYTLVISLVSACPVYLSIFRSRCFFFFFNESIPHQQFNSSAAGLTHVKILIFWNVLKQIVMLVERRLGRLHLLLKSIFIQLYQTEWDCGRPMNQSLPSLPSFFFFSLSYSRSILHYLSIALFVV